MKFTDGYWLKRPGVTVVNPKEVCDIKIQENSVTLYISPWKVTNRGMTLQGPLIALTFTSPRQDILAAEITHFQGGNKKEARFQLNKKRLRAKSGEKRRFTYHQKRENHSGNQTFRICSGV